VALQYDTGDYHACMDEAQSWPTWPASRRAGSQRGQGLKRGIGYSSYIEACGLAPSNIAGALGARAGLFEAARCACTPRAA
jgi:carbon-monoxide dehydrogenase large subunit